MFPFEFLFKKTDLMFVCNKYSFFFIKQNIKTIGNIRLCDIKVLFNKIGQKYINYLCPVFFNSLPFDVKNIYLMIKLT